MKLYWVPSRSVSTTRETIIPWVMLRVYHLQTFPMSPEVSSGSTITTCRMTVEGPRLGKRDGSDPGVWVGVVQRRDEVL